MLLDSSTMFKIVESLGANNNINNNKIASVRNVSQNISLCKETLKLKRIHSNNVNKSFSHNRTNVWIHILISLFLTQLNFSDPWEIILNKMHYDSTVLYKTLPNLTNLASLSLTLLEALTLALLGAILPQPLTQILIKIKLAASSLLKKVPKLWQ